MRTSGFDCGADGTRGKRGTSVMCEFLAIADDALSDRREYADRKYAEERR